MSRVKTTLIHVVGVLCAIALLCGVPARGLAVQASDEGACAEAQRCLDLLQDGIDFIEAGRWEVASVVLEEVAAGLEGHPSRVRDLARALVYLGVARLQVADANETRQLFAEAQVRDPALQLDPAEFPRDVLQIWEEARELDALVVESEPPGAEVSVDGAAKARPLREAIAEQVPADVLTTAERLSADTTKLRTRSMWRTLVGALGIAAGVVVAGRQCDLDGAERWDSGAQVETLAGVVQATRFRAAPHGRSKYVRWWGGCRLRYDFTLTGPNGSLRGTVEDHEAMLGDSAGAPLLTEEQRMRYVEAMFLDPGQHAASVDEQLRDGLAESVGGVRTGLSFPRDRLAGGLALAGLGALIVMFWSDAVAVDDVAVSVSPTGSVLASRSFGW